MDSLQGDFQADAFKDRTEAQEFDADGGLVPKGHIVLVLPDPVQRESAGGIALPDATIFTNEQSQVFGILVAAGPAAWFDESEPRAQPGDRVMFSKFAGQMYTGPDGLRYRVVNDKDILGVITNEVTT
jgi:co-chaperonin GroES (HSP10)